MGTVWFWMVAGILVAYIVLDGFDIGAGIIHLLISKTEEDRQFVIRSIGPVWDGNEVWLVAAGGTLYFAFPVLYASAFSGFYLALMTIVWLLIFRGIGVELRMHLKLRVWREFFDGCFAVSSVLLAIFYGAGLANVIRGVPLGHDEYFFLPLWTNWRAGANPGILDWYSLVGGLLALISLALHGALYITIKTQGDLQARARQLAVRLCPRVLLLTIASLPATVLVRRSTLSNYARYPIAFLIPVAILISLIGVFVFSKRNQAHRAFVSSCIYLGCMLAGAAVGLYPAMLPSSANPALDITISKAVSGPYALSVGFVWWSSGIVVAIGYFVLVYWMFRGKVNAANSGYGH
jgi:cytochrome d ubiquinol oxidase subunit II